MILLLLSYIYKQLKVVWIIELINFFNRYKRAKYLPNRKQEKFFYNIHFLMLKLLLCLTLLYDVAL